MSDDSPASFTVVILTSGADAGEAAARLEGLATMPGPPREVCLVSGPPCMVPDPVASTRMKLVEEPLGREAVGCNLGLAMAAGDVVVFHANVPLSDDLLGVLGRIFSDRATAAACATPQWAAFRRIDLEAIGGFDESPEMAAPLFDACHRIEAAGRGVVWPGGRPSPPEQPSRGSAHRCLMSPDLPLRRRRPFLPLVAGPPVSSPRVLVHHVDRVTALSIGAMPAGRGDSDPWSGARRALQLIWAELLPHGTRCALVGYPDHWNVGDAAIWWGTRRLLAEVGAIVDYACDPWSYEPAVLETTVPEGPILILGGGNLGDAYRHEQSLRERVLRDFPRRRIIQLPQSIWFSSTQRAQAVADLLLHAGDVTLLVRDATSLAFARGTFRCASALCPDSALALDIPGGWGPPEVPMLALWRTDTEARERAGTPDGDVAVTDWTTPGPEVGLMSTAARGFSEWVGPPPAEIGSCPRRRRLAWRHLPWLWDQLAEDRTLRGCRILSRGRVVLTDRLHAHLLCSLMRKPHVVCDSTNGKVFAHRDTWRIDDPMVRFATTRAEALEMGRDLLALWTGQEGGGDGS